MGGINTFLFEKSAYKIACFFRLYDYTSIRIALVASGIYSEAVTHATRHLTCHLNYAAL